MTESIYFESVHVNLCHVNGTAFEYKPELFSQIEDPSKDTSKTREKSLAKPELKTKKLISPAIPAYDLIPKPDELENQFTEKFPKSLQKPLLKKKEGEAKGFQSGRRSAILKLGKEWFRFKGCGDLYEGFTLSPVADQQDCVELRGCMFTDTCYRELHMTNMINGLLRAQRLPIANEPIGWYEYHLEDELIPSVPKCCAIYKTYGEKRLADHCLIGLERLLPYLIKDLSAEKISKVFPASRSDPDGFIETSLALLCLQEFGPLADFVDISISETVPSSPHPNLLKPRYPLWNECCERLKKYLPTKEVGSLLGYVYWRLGREVGATLKVISESEISWGTFKDLLGFHCNGHPNNFVILSKPTDGCFIAPLDFDMAYDWKSFNQTKDGKKDRELFDEYLQLEINGMRLALAGNDLNSGVQGNVILNEGYLLLKWGLRDTLLLGFESGFNNEIDKHPPISDLQDPVAALLQMSIMLTESDIA